MKISHNTSMSARSPAMRLLHVMIATPLTPRSHGDTMTHAAIPNALQSRVIGQVYRRTRSAVNPRYPLIPHKKSPDVNIRGFFRGAEALHAAFAVAPALQAEQTARPSRIRLERKLVDGVMARRALPSAGAAVGIPCGMHRRCGSLLVVHGRDDKNSPFSAVRSPKKKFSCS